MTGAHFPAPESPEMKIIGKKKGEWEETETWVLLRIEWIEMGIDWIWDFLLDDLF